MALTSLDSSGLLPFPTTDRNAVDKQWQCDFKGVKGSKTL